ncbi:MAG: ubiquitin-like domain-containing protein [Candidatus Heimdallarchaeota archaeon]
MAEKIKITIVSTIGGGSLEIETSPKATVQELKQLVSEQKRIPTSTVVFIFRGRQLADNDLLSQAGVEEGDKLFLVTRTEGGYLD